MEAVIGRAHAVGLAGGRRGERVSGGGQCSDRSHDSRDKTVPESQSANKDEVAGLGSVCRKCLWPPQCCNCP